MIKTYSLILLSTLISFTMTAQTLVWNDEQFEIKNVTALLVQFDGERVLKVERDLKALPFV